MPNALLALTRSLKLTINGGTQPCRNWLRLHFHDNKLQGHLNLTEHHSSPRSDLIYCPCIQAKKESFSVLDRKIKREAPIDFSSLISYERNAMTNGM
nr:hypothetical protein Itr_chr02CG05180 [Ipomoea trifida]